MGAEGRIEGAEGRVRDLVERELKGGDEARGVAGLPSYREPHREGGSSGVAGMGEKGAAFLQRHAAGANADYDSYEIVEPTSVTTLDARRASRTESPGVSFFKPIFEILGRESSPLEETIQDDPDRQVCWLDVGPVVPMETEAWQNPVLDQMKTALGLTDDTYLYRATNPDRIENGMAGLNGNSVALVQDPYLNPALMTDIERSYADLDAAEELFDSMWANGTRASDLDRSGLNVSSDMDAVLSRYGGGADSNRVLIRFRLGDVPNALVYPDIGGGTGDKTILYVTGDGPVPVEVYDPVTQTWGRP